MRAYRRRGDDNHVDLFPFLSMFLCILGVLSFLQILMAATGGRRVVLAADDGPGLRAPLQIYCTERGVIVVPPLEGLRALSAAADTSDRAALRRIASAREAVRDDVGRRQGNLRSSAAPLEDARMRAILDELREVNRIARARHVAYQEFVLFGVYPGGGEHYQRLRAVLDAPEHREVQSGVEVLDAEFEPAPLDTP
jgi:hypothetical protein